MRVFAIDVCNMQTVSVTVCDKKNFVHGFLCLVIYDSLGYDIRLFLSYRQRYFKMAHGFEHKSGMC
jgi:hypothetical protein